MQKYVPSRHGRRRMLRNIAKKKKKVKTKDTTSGENMQEKTATQRKEDRTPRARRGAAHARTRLFSMRGRIPILRHPSVAHAFPASSDVQEVVGNGGKANAVRLNFSYIRGKGGGEYDGLST